MYFFLNVLAIQEPLYVCTDIRLLSVFVTVRKLTSPHFITRLKNTQLSQYLFTMSIFNRIASSMANIIATPGLLRLLPSQHHLQPSCSFPPPSLVNCCVERWASFVILHFIFPHANFCYCIPSLWLSPHIAWFWSRPYFYFTQCKCSNIEHPGKNKMVRIFYTDVLHQMLKLLIIFDIFGRITFLGGCHFDAPNTKSIRKHPENTR